MPTKALLHVAEVADAARKGGRIGVRAVVQEIDMPAAQAYASEVVAKLHAFRDAGASRVYLQTLDIDDLDHIELVAADVAPL